MKTNTFVALLICFGILPSCVAQKTFVRISKDSANIRNRPDLKSSVIFVASKSDIFAMIGEENEFYSIKIFNPNVTRYIHKSTCEIVTDFACSLPDSIDTRRMIFKEIVLAERRSSKEARNSYSPDDDVMLLLYTEKALALDDEYKVQVMHKYKLPIPCYNDIVNEGLSNKWPPLVSDSEESIRNLLGDN